MLFNSLEFVVFLGVVVVAYHLLGHRLQNRLLLAASYWFYGSWDWRFLGLIALSTAIDYTVARRLEREIVKYVEVEEEVTVATATTGINSEIATEAVEAERFRTFLLATEGSGLPIVVGAVAIAVGKRPLRAPLQGFLTGVAESLIASGDVTALGTQAT